MILSTFKNEVLSYEKALIYTEMSSNTMRKYMQALRNFTDYAETAGFFVELNKDCFIAYKDYLTRTYKPNTVNLYITALNKYLYYLGATGLCVKALKVQPNNSVENGISIEEYNAMLEAAKKLKNNTIYYVMRALASTGVRISTLKYFTIEAVESGSCMIQNKGKVRTIVIPGGVCKELVKYCRERGIEDGYIFRGQKPDRVITEVSVRRWLKKVAALAGVDGAKAFPHNLRHLFAKRFMDVYNDLPELADILGHTRLETTRIYTRTSSDEKRKKLENLSL